MLVNPLLKEMSSVDISRRYSGVMAWYRNEIVLFNGFSPQGLINEGNKSIVSYTSANENRQEVFKWDELDISRPEPRWVQCGKMFYYIWYNYKRQWHRGFCSNNTNIRNHRQGKVSIPSYEAFPALTQLYMAPKKKVNDLCQQQVLELAKDSGVILSPQIFITDDKSGLPPLVFFRELLIGRLGSVVPLFEQELKELIGDYKNEYNAQASRRNKPRPVEEDNDKPANLARGVQRNLERLQQQVQVNRRLDGQIVFDDIPDRVV